VRNDTGETPLTHAVNAKGGLEALGILIEAGASSLIVDHKGRAPLHRAVEIHDLKLTEMLMASGANCLIANKSGNTPLVYAAESMNEAAYSLLLQHGADRYYLDRGLDVPGDSDFPLSWVNLSDLELEAW
jgi:ankyrin repeat protein